VISADGEELEFVAKVSHELRGPLHSILGLSELMIESGLEGESNRLATAIHREAGSLRVMIDDLLNFARINAGRLELVERPFSPARLVADIVASARPSAARKGLSLLVNVDPAVPRAVSGDELRYGQVIRNLVNNSIRYTDRGSVTVTVGNDGDAVICAVADTGIGIGPEAMSSLFEPFHQGHVTRPGGTGLGLAISRRIVALMGGDIHVDSAVGEGSVFRVAITFDRADAVVVPEVDDTEGRERSGRVLVVEDSEVNQMLATSQLALLGFEAEIAPSGEVALELVSSGGYEAILMDWNLPGLDGLETTRRMRDAEGGAADVPIIAMTANALTGDRERCLDAGMDDFLSKPVSIEDLSAVLDRHVREPERHSAAGALTPRHNRSVDVDVLDALAAELGDDETVRTLVATFLDELPQRHQAIVDGVAAGDLVTARRAAHTLKSTSALLGARDLAHLCASFCAGDDDPASVGLLAAQIEFQVGDVTDALRVHLHCQEQA